MNFINRGINEHFNQLYLKALLVYLLGIFSVSQAAQLSRDDYFEIARVITRKSNGKKLVLGNILAHHVSTEFGKSYFQTNDPARIEAIIDAVIAEPSFHDFSRSAAAGTAPKLMVIKDFTRAEALALTTQEFIGIHVRPDNSTIPSNRVTLFFAIDKLVARGRPWEPTEGVLLTGFPDNPERPYGG